jgi:drug/metabolite transporter (DMT)-like permease
MPNLRDYLQLHFIVLIWGFTAILGLLISVSSLGLVFYRTWIASVLLASLIYFRGRSFKIPRTEFLKIIGTGFLIGFHWILFFGSAKVSNASVCLAGMTTATLWTSVLEPITHRRSPKPFEIILGLIIIGGLYIIFRFEFDHIAGLLMAVGSAFLAALFSVINSKLVQRHDHWLITFYEMVGACLITALILPFYQFYWIEPSANLIPTTLDWFYLFILGGICTVYAYSIGVKLMKKFTPFAINLTVNLEPVYGIILAFLIFKEKEKMTPGFYIGTTIILIAVLSYPSLKKYFTDLKRKRILKAIEARRKNPLTPGGVA